MRNRASRGFTLVELMVSVAVVGMLSSVAIPNFQRAALRAKKAERDTVLDGVTRGVQGILIRQGKFAGPGGIFKGDWNPAGAPTVHKRRFDYSAANWKEIDLQVQGDLYHSYYFVGDETKTPTTMVVWAQGDLDGDGDIADRTVTYELREGALLVKLDDVDTDSIF